jgi:hypothetical protein
VAEIITIGKFLSLHRNSVTPSLSSTKKGMKKEKIKFNTKIEFLKFRRTGYLIAKKDRGVKCTFKINFKATIYFTRPFHLNHLSFNSTFPPNKTCNWMLIWVQKSSIIQNKV